MIYMPKKMVLYKEKRLKNYRIQYAKTNCKKYMKGVHKIAEIWTITFSYVALQLVEILKFSFTAILVKHDFNCGDLWPRASDFAYF